jgi:hypothetical protein
MSVELLDPPAGLTTRTVPRADPVPRPRERRSHVFPLALIASILVHVLVFAVFRFEFPAPGRAPAATDAPVVPEGMRIVQVRVVAGSPAEVAAPAVRAVTTGDVPIVSVPPDAPPLTVTTPEPPTGRVPTVSERIMPRPGDPRLFAQGVRPLPLPATPEEIARARLAAAVGALADSMMSDAERAARALDWTLKDGNGGKWGVSPRALHLGGITLPLPFAFAPSADMAARTRAWNEINAQRAMTDLDVTLEARIKAIRERNDAKRDSIRRGGGGD